MCLSTCYIAILTLGCILSTSSDSRSETQKYTKQARTIAVVLKAHLCLRIRLSVELWREPAIVAQNRIVAYLSKAFFEFIVTSDLLIHLSE